MSDKPVKFPIEIPAGDTSGLDALSQMEQSIARTNAVLEDAKKTGSLNGIEIDGADLQDATLKFNTLSAQVSVLGRELVDAAVKLQEFEKGTPEFDKQSLKVAKLTAEYAKLGQEISNLPDDTAGKFSQTYDDRASKVRENVGVYGDSESALRTVGGAVGALGGGAGAQIQQLSNLAAEFLAVGEALPLLKEGLGDIASRAAKTGTQLAEGGSRIAQAGAAAGPALLGISAGAGAIAAVAAAVLAPLLALVGGIKLLQHVNEQGADATRILIKEQDNLFKLLVTGTQEETKAKLEELQTAKDIADAQVETMRGNLEQFEKEAGVFGRAYSDIFNTAGAREYREKLQEAEKASNDAAIQISLYNQVLNDSSVIARSQAKALVDAADSYVSLTRAIKSGDFDSVASQIDDAIAKREEIDQKIAFLERAKIERSAEQQAAIQAEIDKIKTDELTPAIDNINTLTTAVRDLGYSSLDAAKAAGEEIDYSSRISALKQQIDLQKQVDDLVKTGSSEQFKVRQDQIAREIEAIQSIVPELEDMAGESEDARNTLKEYNERLVSLGREQDTLTSDTLRLIQAREQESAAIQDALSAIDSRIQLETQAQDLIREASSEQIEARLQALDDEKRAIDKQIPQLSKLAAESDEAAAKLAEYRERLKGINDETSMLNDDVSPAVRAREFAEAQAEIIQTETESAEKVKAIREDALKTLEKIETKRTESTRAAELDRTKNLDKVAKQATQRLTDANADYMKTSRADLDAFLKDERRAILDQNDEKLRLMEDLSQTLLEAEEDNNVVAFMRAQRDAASKLDTIESDADKERSRRYEDFMAEQEAARVEHEANIAQIQAEAEAERAAAETAFNDKLAQIQSQAEEETLALRNQMAERIKAEEAALAERTAAIKQQYGTEQAMMKENSQARLDAIEQETAAAAEAQNALREDFLTGQADANKEELSRHKDLVKQKVDAERAAYGEFFQAVNTGFNAVFSGLSTSLQAFINSMMQAARSGSSGGSSGGSGTNRSGSSGSSGGSLSDRLRNSATAYAEGGVVTEPTLAILGEKLQPGFVEAVINFKPSEGLPPGLVKGGGGDTYEFSGDINIGNGMSQTQVKEMLFVGLQAAVSGIKAARRG